VPAASAVVLSFLSLPVACHAHSVTHCLLECLSALLALPCPALPCPACSEGKNKIAHQLLKEKRFREAAEMWDQAIAAEPAKADGWVHRASACWGRREAMPAREDPVHAQMLSLLLTACSVHGAATQAFHTPRGGVTPWGARCPSTLSCVVRCAAPLCRRLALTLLPP